MRRIVVVGADTPLGRRVLAELRVMTEVEFARGVVPRPAKTDREARDLDVVPLVPDHRPFALYLEKERIDTVIDCGLAPDRSGMGQVPAEADVISTMCLGAALARAGSTVRSWILVSSTSIYPIGSQAALLHVEGEALPREDETLASSIAEAEGYARDVAHRLPHLNVAILRLQELAGGGVRGPLASLLAQDRVPVPIGFDPTIQLLDLDDAVSALAFAARHELSGVFNVASEGLIHWQDAVRATGHARVPVLPVRLTPFEPALARLGIPFVPAALSELIRFGHAADIAKLKAAGWRPRKHQREILAELGPRSQTSGAS